VPTPAQFSDRDIIMAIRPPEKPSPPHWVVRFSDLSAFVVPDEFSESQVVIEAQRQHSELGLIGKLGLAFHVPSGRFIQGP
jgi:hypothetical protein